VKRNISSSPEPILELDELSVSFPLPKDTVWSSKQRLPVLKKINLTVNAGESIGVVGESGSGKSTLGRAIMRLVKPDSGSLHFDGEDITKMSERDLRDRRSSLQMIFQDPQSSLNPRRRIGYSITQPLIAFNQLPPGRSRTEIAADLLVHVGLDGDMASRYPHELSGGQRQRAGIARAIALEPKLIVADEIVSGLDVSSQATIMTLLQDLRSSMNLTLIFISHDLSVIRSICDRTLVLQNGRVVEQGSTQKLFDFPRHAYTRELIRAIPLPQIETDWLDNEPIEHSNVGGLAMQIKGATALVTGTNRGIGKAFIDALLSAGVKKVYATARDVSAINHNDDRVETHALDITDHAAINKLAQTLSDVDLLINNAGINSLSAFAASDSLQGARDEMEVNYFGTLAMCRAFAPVLKANGGGAIVNMLSILARVNLPLMGSLCASKAAGLSMVQGLRAELADQQTAVIAVMPGAVDTDMSKDFPPPKMAPADVVTATLEGIESGLEEIYPGDMASGLHQGLAADPKAVEKELGAYLP